MESMQQELPTNHESKKSKRDLLKLELKHRSAQGAKNVKIEDFISKLKSKQLSYAENSHVQKYVE